MAPKYELDFAPMFDVDLARLDAFVYPRIRAVILMLQDQAEMPTRNRRLLSEVIWWCPTATWQARVGDFRILYRIEGSHVQLLRVKWKGSKTTEEMGP